MAGPAPTFWVKIVLIGALVALADWLLFDPPGLGLNLGLVLLSWTAALALANPAVLRDRIGMAAVAAAAGLAALQIERATLVGGLLFSLALGVAALAPRARRDADVWRWAQRLAAAGAKALIGPVLDLRRLNRLRGRGPGLKVGAVLAGAVLPVVGGLTFLSLFATANPVIADTLTGFRVAPIDGARLAFWALIALPVSAALRPRGLRRTLGLPDARGDLQMPGVTSGSIVTSLAVFNALFALQNALDAGYLWADARLPGSLTFAEYAHRGAYPLIATAVLAGLFVIVFLRPGSRTAGSRLVRGLVVLWVAQNLFLVASAALRLLDYIGAYDLTRLRIAALIWIGLVAVGLLSILWRLIAGKSASWLVNANAAALAIVLAACSIVDLGAIAATWNLSEIGPSDGPADVDLAYVQSLNGAALVPLATAERRPMRTDLRCQIVGRRRVLMAKMAEAQAHWRGWRWRDARRLDRVRALTGEAPDPAYLRGYACPPGPRPLTPPANPRT
jgi:hypothetical protein